jgi:peptide chain release factor 3
MGAAFHGAYDLRADNLLLPSEAGAAARAIGCSWIGEPGLAERVDAAVLAGFRESAELALAAHPEPDLGAYHEGHLSPVYLGSALRDCATGALLDGLAAAAPRTQPAVPRAADPADPQVAGFVFKVQANMDPHHRDRLAFMRVCSGRLRRGIKLRHARTGKSIGIHNPIFFFAQNRELAEEAWPGDIIGIPNHGTLRVGDTLTEGEELRFVGIPSFAPEILRRVRLDDPMRAKQLRRALVDLAKEGVRQVFRPLAGGQWIVGVVGRLQLNVLSARIAAEYDIAAGFEAAPFETARRVSAEDPAALQRFLARHRASIAEDRDGAPVYLARNAWDLNRRIEDWPALRFSATRERT